LSPFNKLKICTVAKKVAHWLGKWPLFFRRGDIERPQCKLHVETNPKALISSQGKGLVTEFEEDG
jgi:hypothetical protein